MENQFSSLDQSQHNISTTSSGLADTATNTKSAHTGTITSNSTSVSISQNKNNETTNTNDTHSSSYTTTSAAVVKTTDSITTITETAPSTNSEQQQQQQQTNPSTCILQKGDFVRFIEGSDSRSMKKRDSGLARIVRQIPKPQEQNEDDACKVNNATAINIYTTTQDHPYLYDVDFILGGKATGCHRHELVYTTPDAEGMLTDGANKRAKRKRKPSSVLLEAASADQQSSTTKSTTTKRRGGTAKRKKVAPTAKGKKKGTASKGTASTSKRTASTTGTTPSASASSTTSSPTAAATIIADQNKNSKQHQQQKSELFQPFKNEIIVKDLYERHGRDFERSLARLEKIDQFGFLFERPPVQQEVTIKETKEEVQGKVIEKEQAKNDNRKHQEQTTPLPAAVPSSTTISSQEQLDVRLKRPEGGETKKEVELKMKERVETKHDGDKHQEQTLTLPTVVPSLTTTSSQDQLRLGFRFERQEAKEEIEVKIEEKEEVKNDDDKRQEQEQTLTLPTVAPSSRTTLSQEQRLQPLSSCDTTMPPPSTTTSLPAISPNLPQTPLSSRLPVLPSLFDAKNPQPQPEEHLHSHSTPQQRPQQQQPAHNDVSSSSSLSPPLPPASPDETNAAVALAALANLALLAPTTNFNVKSEKSTSSLIKKVDTVSSATGLMVPTTTNVPTAAPPSSSSTPNLSIVSPPRKQKQSHTLQPPITTSKGNGSDDASGAIEQEQTPIRFKSPPMTWHDIRERKEAGWYDMDRMKICERERMRRLGPYRWYRRKKIMNKDNEKKVEKWDVLEQYDASRGEKGGKVKVTLKDVNGQRVHPRVLHPKGIDWELFRNDVLAMCKGAIERDPTGTSGGSGTLGHAANKIMNAVEDIYERTGKRHRKEMESADARHEFTILLRGNKNQEAAMQGGWRKEPFAERKYEPMTSNVICAGLLQIDEQSAEYELKTTLPDSFLGLSYTYNDTGESEGWMKTVVGEASHKSPISKKRTKKEEDSDEQKAAKALAADDGVVQAQVLATMRTLLIGVQDRVMTNSGVLNQSELVVANWKDKQEDSLSRPPPDQEDEDLAKSSLELLTEQQRRVNPDLVEQFVWGLDCYTRRNIMICIEKDLDPETAVEFIEKWLLPAINAVPPDLAHDLIHAARILEGINIQPVEDQSGKISKQRGGNGIQLDRNEEWSNSMIGKALLHRIKNFGAPWLHAAAHQLRRAIEALGHDFFRVHPKGQGSIVLKPKIKANSLVTFYRGEVYPSWRWGEKMDAIDLTQKHIGLRPNLPDFYNMALERPQKDPRGYGMMIIDASRKAGHGSMLSHSCAPTCEVRVAAINGEFVLAMTTLRDIEQGEELTFDYNAVTESLTEYQAAVCLCGYDKCRGSFLHFATADCYQEIMNRNSPIAIRFSNLVKGCMKKVMSEEDSTILETHGFGTAAFGGASFDIRLINQQLSQSAAADSLENVPTWLRTFVADSLRYIEYERRALPISLICEHIKQKRQNQPISPVKPIVKRKPPAKPNPPKVKEKRKKSKESKPAPAFHFYVRKNRQIFLDGIGDAALPLRGLELESAIRKAAGVEWRGLSDEDKGYWKQLSVSEWTQAQKASGDQNEAKKIAPEPDQTKKLEEEKTEPKVEPPKPPPPPKKEKKPKPSKKEDNWIGDVSFEAADAEGISAMEQRIQQLTQTLSRVGRVLARHREAVSSDPDMAQESNPTASSTLHAPLTIMSDREVIALTWNEENGLVKSLLKSVSKEECITDEQRETMASIVRKYSMLETGGKKWIPNARKLLKKALVELSSCLQDCVMDLSRDMKKFESDRNKARAKIRRDRDAEAKAIKSGENKTNDDTPLAAGHEEEEGTAEDQVSNMEAVALLKSFKQSATDSKPKQTSEIEQEMTPRLAHFHERWKLEAASDVLLMYANTSTFFKLVPYSTLDSTPIEVYSRELSNEVPRYKILESQSSQSASSGINLIKREDHDNGIIENVKPKRGDEKKKRSEELCDPEEAIANVTISYKGDYILSQLLQWYNGGIGQKPGLPEMLGCVALPTIRACFKASNKLPKLRKTATAYKLQIRPTLYEWLKDPHKRGSTFPEEMSEIFASDDDEKLFQLEHPEKVLLGSPILDFLVSGDDSGILRLLGLLREHSTVEADGEASNRSAADRLESSLDEGMPAQAIAKWVQCENPSCLKWRRLPFFVDLDVLPEQFFCKDNVWNASAQSCDAQEDAWDEHDAKVKNDGVDKESDLEMITSVAIQPVLQDKNDNYDIGDRYDILRKGKSLFCTGEVVDKDMRGEIKRVKFHFPKVPDKFDEWIEVPSDRVAPLNSKQLYQKKQGKGKKRAISSTQKNTKKQPTTVSQAPPKTPVPSIPEETEEDVKEELPEQPPAEQDRNKIKTQQDCSPEEPPEEEEIRPERKTISNEKIAPREPPQQEIPEPECVVPVKKVHEQPKKETQPKNLIPRKAKQPENQKPSRGLVPRKSVPPEGQGKSSGFIPRKQKEMAPSNESNFLPRKKTRLSDLCAASKLVAMSSPPPIPFGSPHTKDSQSSEVGSASSREWQHRPSFSPSSAPRPHDRSSSGAPAPPRNSSTPSYSSYEGGGGPKNSAPRSSDGSTNGKGCAKASRWGKRHDHAEAVYQNPKKDEPKQKNHPLLGSRFVPRNKNT